MPEPFVVQESALILVVDDDPAQRLIFKETLVNAGYRVEEAADGNEALEKAKQLRPDLIALDVMMPGMDGFETCAAIRRNETMRHIPVMMVTGLEDVDSIERGFVAGATDFVTKPVNWLLLEYSVMYLLRTSRMEGQLRAAKDEAESANRAKTAFIANISHELRTPLHAIIGFSEVMHAQTVGAMGDDIYRDYLEEVLNGGRNLLTMIDSIIDLAKAESGSLSIQMDTVDLSALVDSAIAGLTNVAMDAGIALTIDTPKRVVPVRGDETRLRQMLAQVVSNAVKFTPEAGTVTVSLDDQSNEAITIAVSDTGVGMAADEIATALSPFSQVNGSLSRPHQGAGVGLPLAATIARLHNANLSMDSAPGEGTRVTIKFPAACRVS